MLGLWLGFFSSCSLFQADYSLSAETVGTKLLIQAEIHNYHGDFIHMSIRQSGYDNRFYQAMFDSPSYTNRDWSRVVYWFDTLHPDTWLEGRLDNGTGRGPLISRALFLELPLGQGVRTNYADSLNSGYEYITKGYSYADGHSDHPGFPSGEYTITLYPWYTGPVNREHPSALGRDEVQYIHYDVALAETSFTVH